MARSAFRRARLTRRTSEDVIVRWLTWGKGAYGLMSALVLHRSASAIRAKLQQLEDQEEYRRRVSALRECRPDEGIGVRTWKRRRHIGTGSCHLLIAPTPRCGTDSECCPARNKHDKTLDN